MKGFLFMWNFALTIALLILWTNSAGPDLSAQVEANRGNIATAFDFMNENRELIRDQGETMTSFVEALEEPFVMLAGEIEKHAEAIKIIGEYLDQQAGQQAEIEALMNLIKLLSLM